MSNSYTFWFDLENPPDVLFFEPIAKRLRAMGHRVYTTAREYSNVPQLARLYGIEGQSLGRYGGKAKPAKVAAGLKRSGLLARWSRGRKIDLAVGFGSRPLAVACGLYRVPNATVFDYEHVSIAALNRFCNWIFVPQEVSTKDLALRGTPRSKIIKYAGLKEEVYTGVYRHTDGLLSRLGYDEEKVIVTMRPPATNAHYHDHDSEIISRHILEKIANDPSVLAIYSRRDADPTFDEFLRFENIRKLERPVRGLDLLTQSDVVISGGGTMVREAVALGIPAYSTFTGRLGAVDERLSQEGRLIMIRKHEDISKIRFRKRNKATHTVQTKNSSVLDFFVRQFIHLAARSRS